jgi:ComF family protein
LLYVKSLASGSVAWVAQWFGGLCAAVRDMVYPRGCIACGTDLCRAQEDDFCELCFRLLTAHDRALCARCGLFQPYGHRRVQGCPQCGGRSWAFDGCVAAGPYEGLLRELCLRFKDVRYAYLARGLAGLLCRARQSWLLQWAPDLVVGIPRHWARKWQMGYDQTAFLARALVDRLRAVQDVSYDQLLVRHRWTRVHVGMDAQERAQNLRGAFRYRGAQPLRGARVLLLDDVLTSGATASEAAACLKAAGAAAVYVAVLARAQPG